MTTILAGRYELTGLLGSGGMARVHVATDLTLGRSVAVKRIRDDLLPDPTARERLLREARAAASLDHPNAVAVFDVGEDVGGPFIVMELVTGESLDRRLARDGTLPPAEAVAVGAAVLAVLAVAHERGLVHRDIKPANVMLTDQGGVKLADFGIAKGLQEATSGLTGTGQILGTPSYLSPEQADGQPATPRSDLYALGVLLYECVVGRPPFSGGHAVAVALAHQRDPVPPLADVAPHVDAGLAGVIETALAKDPGERFADAATMRAALDGATRGDRVRLSAGAPEARSTAAATQRLPEDSRPSRDDAPPSPAGNGGGRGRLAAGLVVAALALLAAFAVFGGGGAPDEPAPAQSPGPDEPRPEPDPGPQNLDELAALLIGEADTAGDKGRDLRDAVLELRDTDDVGERRSDALELLVDVAEWRRDDELDADVADVTIGLLAAEGRRPGSPALADASMLVAEVARDLDGAGEKGEDLLEDLAELLDGDDAADWADDAADLLDDLDDWLDDGEIDARVAADARRVLEALAGSAADADSGDSGPPDHAEGEPGGGEGRTR